MSYTQEFNFNTDLMSNLLWQDDYPENIKGLMQSKDVWYNSNFTEFLDNWFTDVFNLKTANMFGCVVWGIILNVPINPAKVRPVIPQFGYDQYHLNFDNGNFKFIPSYGSIALLEVDECRRLLRCKYYAQTISPTIGQVDEMLADVFGDLGVAFLVEGPLTVPPIPPYGFGANRNNFASNFGYVPPIELKVMEQAYIFLFPIREEFKMALLENDIMPRGSGVKTYIVEA